MRGLGAVGIEHVHAVLWERGLGAGPLAGSAFPGLAGDLCVVVVRAGADQAEVGGRVVGPHTAAVLRVRPPGPRGSHLLLTRHLAVVQQVLGRRGDAQHGPPLGRRVLVRLRCRRRPRPRLPCCHAGAARSTVPLGPPLRSKHIRPSSISTAGGVEVLGSLEMF